MLPNWRGLTLERSLQRYIKRIDKGLLEGHVQDGHLDLSVLLRRADFRCRRPVTRFVDSISPARTPGRRHRPWRVRDETVRRHALPLATIPSMPRCSMSAASMPSASAASTCLEPRSVAICSTRAWQHARKYRCAMRRTINVSSETCDRSAACSARPAEETGASRPLREVEPATTSSNALPPARCRLARSAAKPIRRWPSP